MSILFFTMKVEIGIHESFLVLMQRKTYVELGPLLTPPPPSSAIPTMKNIEEMLERPTIPMENFISSISRSYENFGIIR